MGEFISNNIALVALFLASGVMLVWPELSKLMGVGGAEIGTLEATRLMNQGSALVLDVREAGDFAAGHLPRARHIPIRELSKRLEEISKYKAKPVIVTDRSGPRAGAACRLLKQAGFTSVYQLRGGVNAWQQASLPVEK
ncbi:MAG TPA: rhodanese-like domain-containing protein [Usitatibacter sp.]|nr:rhodanese-like domain-containing protein [Usitatibacter sp.]